MAISIELAVDTSALTAILLGEPEAGALLGALALASRAGLSAANRTELLIVMQSRLGDAGAGLAKTLLAKEHIHTIPVDRALADMAADAYRRFGKGRHPASLKYGDCFSYALATREGAPLLFKGDDFALTDVGAASYPVRPDVGGDG